MAISKIQFKSSPSDTPVVWMDTTDKTVNSGSMLNGITALKNDGTTATGNIASKSSSDLTASNLTVTAPSGYYASNATKTLSDQNLTSENIKKDVPIFGVMGSYEGGGGTETIIVPEQTINAQSSYTQIQFNSPLVDGEEYTWTVNGTTNTGTASSQYGSVILYGISGTVFDYSSPNMYFDVTNSSYYGTYTIKVVQQSGGSVLVPKTITENGTYDPTDDNADGYSSVTVNVSGGGTTWEIMTQGSFSIWQEQGENIGYFRTYLTPFVPIELGEVWRITWNNTVYVCEAQELFSTVAPDGLGYCIGNASAFGGTTGNNEPFVAGAVPTNTAPVLWFLTTATSGTVKLIAEKQVSDGDIWETVFSGRISITSEEELDFYGVYDPWLEDITQDSVYKVTFDGTPYMCTATFSSDWFDNYCLGNPSIVGESETGNNEPFMICRMWGQTLVAFAATSQSPYIKIQKLVGNLIPKTITANGTYSAMDDNADGYSEVTVNVSSVQTTLVIPEQTISISSEYAYINNIIEPLYSGETYIMTIDGVSVTATSITQYNFPTVYYDAYTSFVYANGSMVFSVEDSSSYGTHVIKVEKVIGGVLTESDVNFYDYDGTLLHSYTAQETQALSALPANPSHTGLTAQGWNWTLAQIKSQLTNVPGGVVNVGQSYVTTSGKTEIDVKFVDMARLSPVLTIAVNGTVSIEWGDNTTADIVTGTTLSSRQFVQHTYANTGNYTISISVTSGSFTFYGSSTYTLLKKTTTASSHENKVYTNCVQNIRLGSGITTLKAQAFINCLSLISITIPNTITSMESDIFSGCYSLISVTIPNDITSIATNTFSNCESLTSVSIPSGITSIGSSAFNYCYSLKNATIPYGITSIPNNIFSNCPSIYNIVIPNTVESIGANMVSACYSLANIAIPSKVTEISANAFYSCYSLASITLPSDLTTIGSSVFNTCYSLASITIPSKVTSIGNTAFANCYGVKEYHIQPTTVPTGGTTMFTSITSDCIIYVPYSADHSILNAYKTETNWSTYASYMQEEPQP